MNAVGTICRLPEIFRHIEHGGFQPSFSHHVRGRRGQLLGITGNSLCYPLEQSRNADQLKRLLLEVEDQRFYRHGAVDYKGILRAIIRNLRAGKVHQGGSTITQQLARTLFLDPSRTWLRKLTETIIAFKLEKHLTKEQILDAYCNSVYMGRGSRGFEAASRIIFRKSFKNLAPEQIPSLIGLLGAPERFHPGNSEQKFWDRAAHKARSLGMREEKVPLNPVRITRTPYRRIEIAARKELLRLSLPQQDIKSFELTIDEPLQKSIDSTLRTVSMVQEIAQVAAVVISNKTGDILAESAWAKGMQCEFSPSFSGHIQPGSTFKTFALLTAIECGLSTETIFTSAPYCSEGEAERRWSVRNYGNRYHNQLTLEEALAKSDNTVFARLADCLNQKELASTYDRFTLIPERFFSKSATLGGIRQGVSLLQLTNAYASIARNGVAIEPRLLRFVEYQDNSSIFVRPNNGRIVADYAAVQKLKRILELSGLRTSSYNIPGKTGTTKKGSLFTGYNEDVSIGLWLDFAHEQPEHDPKALTAIQVMKKLGHKLLAWTDQREFAIF